MKKLLLASVLVASTFAAAQPASWDISKNGSPTTDGTNAPSGASLPADGSSSGESDATRLVDTAAESRAAIKKTVLAEAFKTAFDGDVTAILKKAGCRDDAASMETGAGAGKSGGACSAAKPDAILTALEDLAKLNLEVEKAVKVDGDKTLPEVYAGRAKELKTEIDSSKLAQADKTTFLNRLDAFQKKLAVKAEVKGETSMTGVIAKGLTAEEAKTQFDALKADVKEGISLAAKGETLMQEYAAESKAFSSDIEKSVLAAAFKDDYKKRLAKIDADVCIVKSPMGAAVQKTQDGKCGPIAAEAGLESLKDLQADFNEAVKKDGSKTLAEIYATKLDALKEKARGARIDADDMATLTKRFDAFANKLSGKASPLGETIDKVGSKDAMTPEKAESDFTALRAEVNAAVKLAEIPGTSFALTLADAAKKFDDTLKASKLNADLKAEFNSEEATALEPVKCLTGAAKGMSAGAGAGKCAATFVDILDAEKSLDALAKKLDKAITKDGSKSMSALYAPKIERLTSKLDESNVDAADKTKLQARIKTFTDDLKTADDAKESAGAGAGKKPFTAEDAEDVFSQLKDDVAAAIDIAKSKH